ncbi:hypothetical protein M0R72_07145 [Candidatus Pacearchaeota archaeon]|jgi:hypothetical protein|nr:hypothetical protein [Candidatus Pacearchaeota archaeon]
MSDIADRAEAILNKTWHYPEDAYAAFEMLPELVTEIKRLREEKTKMVDDWQDELDGCQECEKDYEGRLSDLMANCNQLRTRCWKAEEDCKRWQQVAIEAKAVLHFVNFPNREQGFYLQPKEIQDNYRKQTAKELGLQMEQEASYTDRLERLALSMCLEAGWDQSDFEAALAEIREGICQK